MKSVFALAFAGAATAASVGSPEMEMFERFVTKFNKSYDSSEEYFQRMAIFTENVEKINARNADHVEHAGTAVFGINKFSDLSEEEFANFYLNKAIATEEPFLTREEVVLDHPNAAEIDWRSKGVLTPIKNQAQCGSCWAFSATSALESFAKIAGKDLDVLSPQQIVSCDKTDGGCNGGWPYKAFQYVQGAGGIELDADYPYTSGTGQSGVCKFDQSKTKIVNTGYKNVARGEANLETALNLGPVSIAVDASSWSSYSGGVLSRCGQSVDHAVQAVGYTADYWIVRNSWGGSWGESGYIRIARGSDLCLISDYVSYPTFD